ncbi:MAG: enoyl-CoA hydratase [Acidobacteria bacterium]|nr:enoyl-CoA hydratase [Acidobacteriota bacterium]
MPTYTTLLRELKDNILTITLHRPERRNALNPAMVSELTDALESSAQERCGVVVLTGTGAAFCSGLDLEHLKTMQDRGPMEHHEDSENIARLLRTLYDLPKPTIAAVNGPAIAGGMGLATICDFTLSVPTARFGYTEVRIGFIPAIVASFLIAQVGEKRARDLLLSGRFIEAEEALALGLVTRLVEAPELMTEAHNLARMLLQNSPESLRGVKRLLSEHARARLDRELHTAVEENADARATADFKEGVRAFLEKRAPVWPSLR